MRKNILLISVFLCAAIITSCTKEMFMSPERRIVGSWELVSVTKMGIGVDRNDFEYGYFTFFRNGSVNYAETRTARSTFEGNWRMNTYYAQDCYECADDRITSLTISVYDSDLKMMKTELFEEIIFNNFNARMKAYKTVRGTRYIFTFERRKDLN